MAQGVEAIKQLETHDVVQVEEQIENIILLNLFKEVDATIFTT